MTAPQDQQVRALYDEHAAALWRYVVRLTGDRQQAEDIVQEVVLRAWRRPKVLDQTDASARSWMFTVARHLVIDESRSAHHRHEVGTEHPPEACCPDRYEAALDEWIVGEALAQLSANHRRVVIGAYYRGLSTAQLAAEMAIPEGTVKSRLYYGIRALREALRQTGVTR